MRYVVWVCDSCQKKTTGDQPNCNWKAAVVRDAREKAGIPTALEKHWCNQCWARINEPLPQEKTA